MPALGYMPIPRSNAVIRKLIGCLHDPANVWTSAGSLLDVCWIV